jgi:hypothetical protein
MHGRFVAVFATRAFTDRSAVRGRNRRSRMGGSGRRFHRMTVFVTVPIMIVIAAMFFPGMKVTVLVAVAIMVAIRGDVPDFCIMMPVSATVVIPVPVTIVTLAHVAAVMIFIVMPIIAVMILGERNSRQTDSKNQ